MSKIRRLFKQQYSFRQHNNKRIKKLRKYRKKKLTNYYYCNRLYQEYCWEGKKEKKTITF